MYVQYFIIKKGVRDYYTCDEREIMLSQASRVLNSETRFIIHHVLSYETLEKSYETFMSTR